MAGTHSAVPPAAAPRTAASRFSANPRIPWLAGPHGDVLTGLRGAVFGGAGLLVLTGDAGTGKTLVARTLAELMRAQGMAIARLDRPAQSPDDFLQAAGEAYGWPDIRSETVRATAERYLADAHARGTRALLIVEDAHRLGRDVPAQVALLVKLARQHGADQRPPLTVLLVGRDRFLETLDAPENAVLESLIDGRYRLRPLTEDEVHRYVERLVVAESAPHVFTRAATNRIAEVSRGIPREIDALCEAALIDTSRERGRFVGTKSIPASAAAANATRQAAPPLESAVPVAGRRRAPRARKAYTKTVLAGVGVLVLVALPAAYTVRHVRPQPAAARMRPSLAPPSQPANVVVPVEAPRVEPPTPAPPTVQESVVTVPETSPTPPAAPPAPPPTAAVAAPSVAAPASRERPILRSEPPTPAVGRPMAPREHPLASQRAARPAVQRAEPDSSAVIDWLFRDAPRASD
jgi:type II secretory pathway predicted ATPase ExeA